MVGSETGSPVTTNGERVVPEPPPATAGLAQRLHDTARFAGRVAHDFDNVLMGVMGFAELTHPLLDPSSSAAKFLGEILRVAQRGLEATRQMHQFSRSGQAIRRATRLDEAWLADEANRTAALPDGARADADLPPDLPPVAIAPDPLLVVLRALVQNAAEAMPAGGTVAVSARTTELSDPQPAALPAELPPGRYVEITIADTGTGFRPEVLPKLATELFVTTKVRHRGLGLATVLRTLHVHGGGLTIESTPRGTAVRVYLPTAITAPSAPGPDSHAPTTLEDRRT